VGNALGNAHPSSRPRTTERPPKRPTRVLSWLSMTARSTVSSGAFRDVMAPTADALRGFAAAVDERHQDYPWADSPAMSEIAVEQGYAKRSSWENPITDTHMLGGLTLRAATDYVRGFAETLAADNPPVYAHLVLARSALEACVISSWLNQLGIGSSERIKRGLYEQVYSATELARLGIESHLSRRVDQWTADAKSLGWDVTDHDSGHALLILRALRLTARARFWLMGWKDDQRDAVCRDAEKHELALLRHYERASPTDSGDAWASPSGGDVRALR
jgi:hypothetical protein